MIGEILKLEEKGLFKTKRALSLLRIRVLIAGQMNESRYSMYRISYVDLKKICLQPLKQL